MTKTMHAAQRQRRVKRSEVRRRLLAAAYGVFADLGYEGASLERVAEAAGFSKGAVYSNFANKDELFFELVAARIDDRVEAVQSAVAGWRARLPGGSPAPDASALAFLAGKELRVLGAADPDWQMLFIEFWLRCARSEDLRARLAERRRGMRATIAQLIQAAAESAGTPVPQGKAMDLATTVLALSNGLGIEGLIDPKAVRPALFGVALARLFALPE
jgi:AcrR family transcriptional regulator